MEFSELKKLAVAAAKAERGTSTTFSFNGATEQYSAEEINKALSNEFKKLTGYIEGKGCSYRTYQENKNLIFDLIEQTITEVLPPRIEQNYMRFADVQRIGQGDKAKFRIKVTEAAKRRARTFVTRVGLAGRYETFILDGGEMEVQTGAIGSAARIGFEEFLDGRWQFSDFTSIILEQMDYFIYQEVGKALTAMLDNIPAVNKATVAGFDEDTMDELLAIADTYGKAAIYCTQEFANKMIPSAARISEKMKDTLWEKGWLLTYKGHEVIILEQSLVDETNREKVIDPAQAYIIPVGSEKPIKVVFEGQVHVREVTDNDDWSTDMQTYVKVGIGTIASLGQLNWICAYRNTDLKKQTRKVMPSDQDDPGTIDSGDYDNLTDAIDAVPEGGTLKLTDNVSVESLNINKDITIDLNGNTLVSNQCPNINIIRQGSGLTPLPFQVFLETKGEYNGKRRKIRSGSESSRTYCGL